MARLVLGTDKSIRIPAIVKEVEKQEKYALLSRVKDDSNNEIGTVCGYHTDANNQKYAVICLDAQFRLASGQYLSAAVEITGLPVLGSSDVWQNTDTATSNCTKILDFATANGYTSTGVSHCRSKSFIIDSTTYYGQLPTLAELADIYRNKTSINTKDTSASQYSSLIVPLGNCWTSTQRTAQQGWYMGTNGSITGKNKDSGNMILPILEIPIN